MNDACVLYVLYCGIEWCCQYDMAQFYHTICVVGTLPYCQQHSMYSRLCHSCKRSKALEVHRVRHSKAYCRCARKKNPNTVKDMIPVTYIRISKFHHRISMVTEILVECTGIIQCTVCGSILKASGVS